MFTVTTLPISLGTMAPGCFTSSFTLPATPSSKTRGFAGCPLLTSVQRFTNVLSQTLPIRECSRIYEGTEEEMLRSTDHLGTRL